MQKIICITGPMAAGKNYVCSLFENKGWLSIDADQLIHSAIKQAEPQIIQTFLPYAQQKQITLTNADGSLNRRELGKLIFPSKELLHKQEQIVYPIFIQQTKELIAANPNQNIILNATVLYKTPELLQLCSLIVFVTCPKLVRFIRAKKRDHLKSKQIISRFKAQSKLLQFYKQTGIPIKVLSNLGNDTPSKVKNIICSLQQ